MSTSLSLISKIERTNPSTIHGEMRDVFLRQVDLYRMSDGKNISKRPDDHCQPDSKFNSFKTDESSLLL